MIIILIMAYINLSIAIILVFLLVVLVSLLVYIYTRVSLKSEKYDGRHLLAVVEKSPMGTLSPRQASDGVASIGSVMINFVGLVELQIRCGL